MITFEKAIEAAQAAASAHVDASASREIREGWFFPYRSDELLLGSNGIIVNKQTGACFMLGSAYPVERDLKAYDEGFRFASYDLTITRVNDEERTLNMLLSLRISTVEPKVANEVEWRIPRLLSRSELRAAISNLPYTFRALTLYSHVEEVRQARKEGIVVFELRESHDPDKAVS